MESKINVAKSDVLSPEEIKKILVIRPRYVGDVLLTIPVLNRLKKHYPTAMVCFLADPAVWDLIVPCPYVDELILFDRRGAHGTIQGKIRFLNAVRRGGFDMAVVLLRSFSSALFPFLARIPVRAGFDTEGRGFLLTHRVTYDTNRYEAECFHSVLDALHIAPQHAPLEVWTDRESRNYVEAWLKENGIGSGERVLCLNPGPSGSPKSFDSVKFAHAADIMYERYGSRIAVTWGPGEEGVAREIVDVMKHPGMVAPPTTLLQLASLLEHSRALVTTDTGPLHLAAAAGTPTVALFGPTNPGKWNPRGEQHAVVKKEISCWPCNFHHCKKGYQCMKLIEIDDILEGMDNVLAERSAS